MNESKSEARLSHVITGNNVCQEHWKSFRLLSLREELDCIECILELVLSC